MDPNEMTRRMVSLEDIMRPGAQLQRAAPDALDITRDSNRHLACGWGDVHHCSGAPLARMEGQIAMGALLRRFPHVRLAVAPETLRWRRDCSCADCICCRSSFRA